MNNKNGSTLILVLLLLSVLSIFSIVTLNLMTNENIQSIDYESKTHAYFVALSGAETVEEALVAQLNSYGGNAEAQRAFLEVYSSPGKIIDVDISGINQVSVIYTDINEEKVLKIESEAEINDVKQVVNKVLYSVESIVTSTNNGQLVIPDNQFLIFLQEGKEHYQGNTSNVPATYGVKVTPEQQEMFVVHPMPAIPDMATLHSSVRPQVGYTDRFETISGEYGTTEKVTNIIVNGNLSLKGTLKYSGEVNFYVRGSLHISSNANISGTKYITGEQEKNQLNFYVYNESDDLYALRTDADVSFNIIADLYIDSNAKVDFDLHQNAYFDGNIVYNGNNDLIFSTQSTNFGPKILTGSIYAPFSTIRLGFHDDKTAFVIGGKVIGNYIHIYSKNKTQANKFYDNSNDGESAIIPVNITENVTTRSISYRSYFSD